jgi:hypothetical protein
VDYITLRPTLSPIAPMNHAHTRPRLSALILIAPLLAIAPACQSSEAARPAAKTRDVTSELVDLYGALKTQLIDAAASVDTLRATVESEDDVDRDDIAVGDVEEAYSDLGASLDGLEKSTASVARARETLRMAVEDQMKSWDADIATFDSAEVRAATQRRRDTTATNFVGLSSELDELTRSVDVYIGRLGVVRQALANDLTPRGIGAFDSILDDASDDVKPVTAALRRAVRSLEEYSGTMSATG